MNFGDWLRRLLGSPLPEPSPPSIPTRSVEERLPPADGSRVDSAVAAMLEHPYADQDRTQTLLEGCGFSPREAWRAYQFLPIAFMHVVFHGRGITFQPGYVLADPDTGDRSSHRLADEPLYAAGMLAATRMILGGMTQQQLLPVYGRSAEWTVVRQLAGPDGRLDGIHLTEPLLMTFAD